MRKQQLWGKKVLAVMLSAAIAAAPIGTSAMAAETDVVQESTSDDLADDVEDAAGIEETAAADETGATQTEATETEITQTETTQTETTQTETTQTETAQTETTQTETTQTKTAEAETTGAETIETETAETEITEEGGENLRASDDIAGGKIDGSDISWRIDSTGKLMLTGTGDYSTFDVMAGLPWKAHADKIKSAEVSITGMTLASGMFAYCSELTTVDLSRFDSSRLEYTSGMFRNCSSLTQLDLSGFKTDNVINMTGMFAGCSSLAQLNLSGFKTDKVTDMSAMFWDCSSLPELDLSSFKTDKVTDMNDMFRGCSSLTQLNLSGFKTDSVTDMSGMFSGCSSLEKLDLSAFDTGQVADMSFMFANCSKLPELALSRFNTENVSSMDSMFSGCGSLTSLELGSFDTSNVNNISFMFARCEKLETLTGSLSTENATTAQNMFSGCKSLKSLDSSGFDTAKVTDMSGMFMDCSSLTELDLSRFDTGKATNMSFMFSACGLTELDLSRFDLSGLKSDMDLFYKSTSLKKIHTPRNLSVKVELPYIFDYSSASRSKWYRAENEEITDLPKGMAQSILITRDSSPAVAEARITASKKKTVYYVGETLNADDLNVQYYGTDGKVTAVTDYTTNKDAVDMSAAGGKDLIVTYQDAKTNKDLTATVKLMVKQAAENIAQGTSGEINWVIDANGKLTVTGNGNWDILGSLHNPWYNYRARIKKAEITVTGMTDALGMFEDCVNLTKADVSGLDTKNVTKMMYMFKGCSSLAELDLSSFNTANVKTMEAMFKGCASLAKLNLSSFNTAKVETIGDMFTGCTSLKELDLSSFDLSGHGKDASSWTQPLDYCTKLSFIRTPKNCPISITLPVAEGGSDKWHKANGQEVTVLPKGQANSINLYKDGYSGGDTQDQDDPQYPDTERIDLQTSGGDIASIKAKVYDGFPYMPVVRVTVKEKGKNKTLIEGLDYRVIYTNNTNNGKGTVIVRGNGAYKGEITEDFMITPKSIKKLKIVTGSVALQSQGTDALPIYVYDGTKLLVSGTDYTLPAATPNFAPYVNKSASVTLTGIGNYKDTVTAKLPVYNVEASKIIGPENVTLQYTEKEYTGRAITIRENAPEVKIGETKLQYNREYKVQYLNNTNAGTAFVIVTGKGAYKGKAVKEFKIIPLAEQDLELGKEIKAVTYNGKLQKPAVTVKVKATGKKLSNGRDYTVSYINNLHNGQAKAVVTGKGNYEGTSLEIPFTILPQEISRVSVKGKKDALVITYGGKELKEGVHFETPSYGEIKGKNIKVTITGKGDFKNSSVTKTVKVQ